MQICDAKKKKKCVSVCVCSLCFCAFAVSKDTFGALLSTCPAFFPLSQPTVINTVNTIVD